MAVAAEPGIRHHLSDLDRSCRMHLALLAIALGHLASPSPGACSLMPPTAVARSPLTHQEPERERAARCRCRPKDSLASARDLASTVVLGTVVADSVAQLDFHGTGDRYQGRIVTVVVGARWKGETRDTVQLRTGAGGGDCGYPFMLGGTYLIVAHGPAENLRTSICLATMPEVAFGPAHRAELGRAVWNGYPLTDPRSRW
jgi:hypothetical protein